MEAKFYKNKANKKIFLLHFITQQYKTQKSKKRSISRSVHLERQHKIRPQSPLLHQNPPHEDRQDPSKRFRLQPYASLSLRPGHHPLPNRNLRRVHETDFQRDSLYYRA